VQTKELHVNLFENLSGNFKRLKRKAFTRKCHAKRFGEIPGPGGYIYLVK
jgi:hypothetical protein